MLQLSEKNPWGFSFQVMSRILTEVENWIAKIHHV